MSLADVYHYASQHFDYHREQLTLDQTELMALACSRATRARLNTHEIAIVPSMPAIWLTSIAGIHRTAPSLDDVGTDGASMQTEAAALPFLALLVAAAATSPAAPHGRRGDHGHRVLGDGLAVHPTHGDRVTCRRHKIVDLHV